MEKNYQKIEGHISSLFVKNIHMHYLENIQQQQNMASSIAILQATMEQAGSVLSSQISQDEGDPVESFIMQVGDKTVCGSFWKTTFKNGDKVEVAGKEKNGVFIATAVIQPDEKIIWIQPHCERGSEAKTMHLIKRSIFFTIFGYIFAILLTIFTDSTLLSNIVLMSICIPVFLLVTVVWSWGDFMTFSRQMDMTGATFGFPTPKKIDLFKSTKLARQHGKPELPMGVYYY